MLRVDETGRSGAFDYPRMLQGAVFAITLGAVAGMALYRRRFAQVVGSPKFHLPRLWAGRSENRQTLRAALARGRSGDTPKFSRHQWAPLPTTSSWRQAMTRPGKFKLSSETPGRMNCFGVAQFSSEKDAKAAAVELIEFLIRRVARFERPPISYIRFDLESGVSNLTITSRGATRRNLIKIGRGLRRGRSGTENASTPRALHIAGEPIGVSFDGEILSLPRERIEVVYRPTRPEDASWVGSGMDQYLVLLEQTTFGGVVGEILPLQMLKALFGTLM